MGGLQLERGMIMTDCLLELALAGQQVRQPELGIGLARNRSCNGSGKAAYRFVGLACFGQRDGQIEMAQRGQRISLQRLS